MSSSAPQTAPLDKKPPRRFPQPCWTQQETLELIAAYRDRWYALRRGYLRTPDWDEVAADVTNRCPGASPPKTSAQCRHKVEKLRQRYRAEKKRELSFPYPAGRSSSPWFYFGYMEAMENGTAPPPSVNPENSPDRFALDQGILKLKLKATNSANPYPDSGFDNFIKSKKFIARTGSINPVDYSPIVEPPLKETKSGKLLKTFNLSNVFRPEILPHGLMMDKIGNSDPILEFRCINTANSNTYASPELRPKYSHANTGPTLRTQGSKRGRHANATAEIVASIKLLAEGFVKMEGMKMEMAREMEAMRMEMEMKRSEMMLESQKQIVDAFLKGLFELQQCKKVKTDSGQS